ncbi:MAG: hypothetical protein IJE71_01795 [Clostridia bacterium]|nr:hypothetical protein [Clostridia bacterium]
MFYYNAFLRIRKQTEHGLKRFAALHFLPYEHCIRLPLFKHPQEQRNPLLPHFPTAKVLVQRQQGSDLRQRLTRQNSGSHEMKKSLMA